MKSAKSGAGAPVLEVLAESLFRDLARFDPPDGVDWAYLDEGEKEVYRACVEGLVVQWRHIMELHSELVGPVR
jgi:hypothetical protein